jgi:hypothetical protein
VLYLGSCILRPGKKKKVGNMTSKRNIWGTFILRPGILEIIYIYIWHKKEIFGAMYFET